MLIHSEAHILKCVNLHYLGINLATHLFNHRRLLPVHSLLYRLSPESQLPEVVLAPAVHSPLPVESQHVGASSRDTYQKSREEILDFSHLGRVCVVFGKGRGSTQTEGETAPREESAIGS
jgi:hypothetical protein